MNFLLFGFLEFNGDGFYYLAWTFLILGIIGSVLPVLPGPPLSWLGMLFAYLSKNVEISVSMLVVTGIVAAIITVMDYILPSYLTKLTGGTKAGSTGATLGMIIGLFLGPLGILVGPFVGALLGEIIHDSENFGKAFKSACGALLGFIVGTGLKLICAAVFIYIFWKAPEPTKNELDKSENQSIEINETIETIVEQQI